MRVSGEIDNEVRAVKSATNKWEEQNNDAIEEVFEFRRSEGGSVRVLGSWVSAEPQAERNMTDLT